MSAVTIQCPLCSGAIQIDSRLSGQEVACPLCQGLMTLPALEGFAATPPPAPPPPPAHAPIPQHTGGLPPRDYSAGTNLAAPQPPPPPTPFEQTLLQLGCPMCGGPFQAPLAAAGQQVECPHCRNPITIPVPSVPQPPGAQRATGLGPLGANPAARGPQPPPPPAQATSTTVVLPTADGRFVAVPEPTKTVGRGLNEVELRRLTPQERSQRRFQRNLILLGLCLGTLFVALYWIMQAGPWK